MIEIKKRGSMVNMVMILKKKVRIKKIKEKYKINSKKDLNRDKNR